jgi:hypothetical protein
MQYEMQNIKSLNPRNLVMTVNKCFYCDNNENIYMVCVDRLFGLKTCPEHKANAKKDINAYMKKNKSIHAYRAMKNNDVKDFFNYFQNEMKVVRSNGVIDSGWKLMVNNFDSMPTIRFHNGEWLIPVIKMQEGRDGVIKNIKLSDFLNPDLGYSSNENFIRMYRKVNDYFSEEIKLDDEEINKEPENYPDLPDIIKYNINGQVVRVFCGSSKI